MFGDDDDLQGLDDAGDDDQDQTQPSQAEVEAEARSLGWVPQDKFRGNKDKWVDAAEFVERGQNLMPILRANNERLRGELLKRDQKLVTLESQLENATTAITKLQEHWSQANKQAVQQAKQELAQQLVDARESGDTNAELEILDKLAEIRTAEKNPAPKPPEKKPVNQPTNNEIHPEIAEWIEENKDWFDVDKKRTKAIVRISEDLRDDGNTLVGRAFMEEAYRILEEQEGGTQQPTRRVSKVGSASPQARAPAGSDSVKGWNDLPKEAKESCLGFVDSLVGPGKAYKTEAEWKKEYVKTYYGQ